MNNKYKNRIILNLINIPNQLIDGSLYLFAHVINIYDNIDVNNIQYINAYIVSVGTSMHHYNHHIIVLINHLLLQQYIVI